MTTNDFFGAGVVALELKGCHLFLICEDGQRTDVPLCGASVNSCGSVADNKFEIVSGVGTFVFDETPEFNPSGLTQSAAEDMVADCSCGNSGASEEQTASILECLEIIKNQQTLGTSSLETVGCVRDGEGKFAEVIGIVFAKENEDGTITFILISSDGTITDPYEGPITLKTNSIQPVPTGECVIDEESPYCGQPVFQCVENGQATCFVRDSETKELVEIEVSKVGKNNLENRICTRPFVCEFPADGADATVTDADIIASLAGGLFPGTTLPTDDVATVHLHDVTLTLTQEGDEAEGGFVATSCQAVVTDIQTNKTKDLEPGGDYPISVAPGTSLPPFSALITA